jgi:hypothetical protein
LYKVTMALEILSMVMIVKGTPKINGIQRVNFTDL